MDWRKNFSESPVIVFGTGIHAARFIYQNQGIKIKYFLDNHGSLGRFKEWEVFRPKKELVKGFIIVATAICSYPDISRQLREEYGLQEFSDFIYYEWLYKELAIIHGNCHILVIRECLLSSEQFSRKYSFYPVPQIFVNKEGRIRDEILKACSLFLHQDVREDNKCGVYLSDKYILPRLNEEARSITIPNLFGLGALLFPQYYWNGRGPALKNGEDRKGLFPHGDRIIDRLVEEGMSKREIIDFCKSDNCINPKEIKENFERYIRKIREREENWDIKILDYILENFKQRRLFYDVGHPANEILKKISEGILKLLEMDVPDFMTRTSLAWYETPVYPIVKKTLDLEWGGVECLRADGQRLAPVMDFDEYVSEYLWWLHDIS